MTETDVNETWVINDSENPIDLSPTLCNCIISLDSNNRTNTLFCYNWIHFLLITFSAIFIQLNVPLEICQIIRHFTFNLSIKWIICTLPTLRTYLPLNQNYIVHLLIVCIFSKRSIRLNCKCRGFWIFFTCWFQWNTTGLSRITFYYVIE